MISLGVARVVGGDMEIFLLDKIRPFFFCCCQICITKNKLECIVKNLPTTKNYAKSPSLCER